MSRVPISAAALLWIAKRAFWKPRRDKRADLIQKLRNGKRCIGADGAWKRHAIYSPLSFMAICDQQVGSVGGNIEDVDCRACLRILTAGAVPVVGGEDNDEH